MNRTMKKTQTYNRKNRQGCRMVVIGMLAACLLMLVGCSKGKDNTGSTASTTSGSMEKETGTENTKSTDNTTETESTGTSAAGNADDYTDLWAVGKWSDTMQRVKDAVVEALGDNYWPDSVIPYEAMQGMIGVDPDSYDDYYAEMPMISVNVDTIIVIHAKDGQVQTVEDALLAYQKSQQDRTMQYPMNLGKIQASQVKVIGDYVCFVQLGGETDENASDEEVVKACTEQNEQALSAVESVVGNK